MDLFSNMMTERKVPKKCLQKTLETYRERIFFIDEGNDFLRTKEFADAVKGADNYFVIISRENFPNPPYSVDEIYGLREGKYREAKRVYNEMYRIYGNLPESLRC